MTFDELIAFCDPISVQGNEPEKMGKLCLDSRKVNTGDIFIAIDGSQADGHSFVPQAVESGASVVIVEQEMSPAGSEAVLLVKNTRELLSPLAQRLAGNPAEKLTIIAITGTNGKTTVATLVWQMLRELEQDVALLGTISKRINDTTFESKLTTSDPVELASDMKRCLESGCKYLVMEVSSHALDQKRVDGIPFEVAAYTNLSLDHLDYHSTMEEYADAKKILFDGLSSGSWAVINADDKYARHMVKNTSAKVIDFSFKENGTVNAEILKTTPEQTLLDVEGIKFFTPLVGKFNAYNVVEALLIGTALGYDGKLLADVLPACRGAEGRLEKVTTKNSTQSLPMVFVDYAHTPDALENVASTLSELKKENQKLLILFGCGGDRDRSKRPEMAKISEKYGDRVIVTSDNPRSEDPQKIIQDIETGFSSTFSYRSIVSRKEAIHTAITESSSNTIVLIAGKGHETYQEINGIRNHFDDREEAREALNKLMRKLNSRGVN
ncbi:UDP-N-acetylmuramoyl-L-alanyl-D-glutamate--2,6-diaminopimelate ligase [Rhodohalobacter barkolensis]|uniref:UDP-N-acetylmuramoyl-L-alanyl-D-glutamate--2,6-diaminopimelate ligase n=1 Tax=Rhodohalobacter barkolensis TaxID=2053187 RepID=A0A2N0VLB4_9BACT|nr:UDP-N-acetylmuramoyl-L-alanyl-D-glutamate--2,6-diaminopimelate ligase [Rhodohalobacter barkolensis]PKD44954.1 UDP-N-acetylmuramoyl-L-alanyl-D-glutamate--2,6-diaminopimelate ligase [Rhodohalobacter barkolensis]